MLLNNEDSNILKKIYGDGNNTQVGHFNNSNNSENINVNSNNNEIELLKNKLEFFEKEIKHLKTALEGKDERLKDKEELIIMLKKNQK
jgi:hypothetical protein